MMINRILLILSTIFLVSQASSLFLTETRSTQLINRTSFGLYTECSIRLGGKDFSTKFYRMITCRYVKNLQQIYPFLVTHSKEITALEFIDSTIESWNTSNYRSIFKRFQFLIFHRTELKNFSSCPFDVFSKRLFYLHVINFKPSLDLMIFDRQCLKLKNLHALIVDQTPIGNVDVLREKFPHLHLLRLNYASLDQPLNSSYIRSFVYLHDLSIRVSDDCHRCEYEWLKYASRDERLVLFQISPQSGCIDWLNGAKFLQWRDAPLCGSCSISLIRDGRKTNEFCRMEDGITEYYCRAFYGHQSQFQPWTNLFHSKSNLSLPSPLTTQRPSQYFMKPQWTEKTKILSKREMMDRTTTAPIPMLNRTIVTRNPINLFNRTYCQVVADSPYRPKILSRSSSIIDQLSTIADEFTLNCSRINCQTDRLNYSGAICLKTGQTYENLCELLIDLCTKQIDMSQATIDYLGQCVNNCSLVKRCFSDDEICVMTPKVHCVRREKDCSGFSPVCDIEGKMFINRCHLSNSLKFNQPRQMAYRGPCRIDRRCTLDLCSSDEICIETRDKLPLPVCIDCSSNATSNACQFELFCGDNQRQYVTRCQLHNDRCQTKTFIRIDRFGLCAKSEQRLK